MEGGNFEDLNEMIGWYLIAYQPIQDDING